MKTVSLIAAGVLAVSWSAARADVPSATDNTMPGTNVDVNIKPPPSNIDVNVDAPTTKPTSPPAAVPGTGTTMPGGGQTPPPANVDVNINPPSQPSPVAAPVQQEVMPPARVIDANTAAITGNVTESAVPQAPAPVPDFYRRGDVHDTGHTWAGRIGTGFLVGGGYEDFTNSNLQRMTGGAGAWNARAIAGTRQFVGVEAAYVGAARGIDALGVQSNAVLMSNGLEGALRLNVPVMLKQRQMLEPFGFVGIGWSHYSVTNTNTNTSDLASDDDVMSLPLGGGLAYSIGRFLADARFTYRSTYYNDMMRSGGSLNNWGVGTQVGFSF